MMVFNSSESFSPLDYPCGVISPFFHQCKGETHIGSLFRALLLLLLQTEEHICAHTSTYAFTHTYTPRYMPAKFGKSEEQRAT